ncbi:MAG: hypothetical protein KDK66_08365, partial [Deltaproteobacteria bacterium]|nr:hypothetical protein [Deltaproteobacteria bacterium]
MRFSKAPLCLILTVLFASCGDGAPLELNQNLKRSEKIAFLGRQDQHIQLYYLDINEPDQVIKINPDITDFGNVDSYQWNPNGKQIAYLADDKEEGVYNLYVYDLASAEATQVNPDFPAEEPEGGAETGEVLRDVTFYSWSFD